MKHPLLLLSILLTGFKLYSTPPSAPLYPILWKWALGKAKAEYHFNQYNNPGIIRNIRDAYQVRRAREFWYDKNMPSFENGLREWQGVTDFAGRFQTVRGIFRAGRDMTEQILGGYTVHIQPLGKDSMQFTVLDIKSRWSLFLHLPFVGNRSYDSSRSRQKLMTDCKWLIQWTEPIENGLFHRRKYNQLFFRRKFSGKRY